MSGDDGGKDGAPSPVEGPSRRGPGGRQPGAGRKPTHGYRIMRKTLRVLTTRRLDQRSSLAVAVRNFKAEIRRDLGGDLTRAQETILEAAAQSWVILSSLDDYIARQPSLVTRRRTVINVVMQRMQIALTVEQPAGTSPQHFVELAPGIPSILANSPAQYSQVDECARFELHVLIA